MLPLALIPILLILLYMSWTLVNIKKDNASTKLSMTERDQDPNQVPVPLGAEFMPFYFTAPMNGKSRIKRCNRLRKAIKARFRRKRK